MYYRDDITRYCSYYSHDDLSVLEVGCGTGELLSGLKGRRKVGIDFSPEIIALAKKKFPDIEFQVMNADDIRLTEKFDLIVLSNLVGLLPDVQHVFRELQKVSHDRTKIIVTYYNYLWEPLVRLSEWLGIKARMPLQNWLSDNDMRNLLYLAGYEVYKTVLRMLIPVKFPMLSHLINKYIGPLPLINNLALNYYCFARPLPRAIPSGEALSVSVIIPARNESGNIENALLRIPAMGKATEVIFVEGNSQDGTWEKIQEVTHKYSGKYSIVAARQQGTGKGDAVRCGFELAKGDVLMILDADLTVPPEDLSKFYEAIVSGKGEFINGSRLVYQLEKHAMRLLNILGNKFFSILFTWLLDQHFKDTLCGTKAIFRKDYERLKANLRFFGDFDPFGDFDLLFGAHKLNLRIIEIPIRYRGRKYGATNISRFKHGFLLLKMCWFAARKIKFV